MARYTGPKARICRRFGVTLFPNTGVAKACDRRDYPPGQISFRRRKVSESGLRLAEKQKVKYYYGIQEKQFRRYYKKAVSIQGDTGANLMTLLERRLDNVVHLMGFASTRAQARQLVSHAHFLVNGRRLDVSSALVKVGDVIEPREKSKDFVKGLADATSGVLPDWLGYKTDEVKGTVLRLPDHNDVSLPVNEQMIVEYMSR